MTLLTEAQSFLRATVAILILSSFAHPVFATPNSKNDTAREKILFEQATLQLEGIRLKVEVAKSRTQQARGLMYRHQMGENEGMLFVYDTEEPLSFWMKNTFLPLSIGFFDRHRVLTETFDMIPVKSEMQTDIPTYRSTKPALYALEVNQGWFARHKIKPGAKFEFISKK